MKELKRYLSYIGKYKCIYWSILLMTLMTTVMLTLLYSYMNKLIFNALEYGDEELFQQAEVLCVVLVVLKCLAPYRRYFQIRVVRKIVFDIKMQLFHKLMKLDMTYYETHHSGEALKTLNWDANSLKDSYFSHIFWVLGRLTNGVASLLAMLLYNPILAMVSISFCMVTVYCSVRINRQMKHMDKEIQKKITGLTERLSDILSGFAVLKMYRGSSIVVDDFMEANEQVTKEENQRVRKAAVLEMVAFLLGILASFGTIAVGAFLVSRGEMDYGTVMAVVSLQMGVSAMVQSFGSALTTFTSSLVKAGRVFDFLELDCEEQEGQACGEVAESYQGAVIEVEHLTYGYDEKQAVLQDFSMAIEQEEKVLLMGESGCGKSTLLKLLLRFREKSCGAIRLYGRDVSQYSYQELRHMITYIPQNSYLFEGTIRENIAMGCTDIGKINEEDIIRAAQFAYADEFISKLPQGYDTRVEAGGSNLSGGQRQRIAIARAFLKDAPILLMDEPSSALDVHSERMVNQAMEKLMSQKVVLMVTHRANSFEQFDRVVRL